MTTQKPLVSLSQVITSQEIPNTFTEGQYGKELREEMAKPPPPPPSPPVIATKKPKPSCVDCKGECRWVSRMWRKRNCEPGYKRYRKTEPGFS